MIDLESIGSNGLNCLHVACGCGNKEICSFLLDSKRCDPNAKGFDGWTALEIAATGGTLEIVAILLRDKRTQTESDSQRGSALHLAAQIPNGFKICQTLLIKNSKLLLVKNSEDQTPSDLAASKNLQDLFSRY